MFKHFISGIRERRRINKLSGKWAEQAGLLDKLRNHERISEGLYQLCYGLITHELKLGTYGLNPEELNAEIRRRLGGGEMLTSPDQKHLLGFAKIESVYSESKRPFYDHISGIFPGYSEWVSLDNELFARFLKYHDKK